MKRRAVEFIVVVAIAICLMLGVVAAVAGVCNLGIVAGC